MHTPALTVMLAVLALITRPDSRGDGNPPEDPSPALRPLATFEDRNPLSAGTVVSEHASQGRKALRLDGGFASMDQPQNWLGYDFLKVDLLTEARKPLDLYVEIRDEGTKDYWTRVNYSTVVPPGKSTLTIPLKQLYVGEKSRPGGCSTWRGSPGWSSERAMLQRRLSFWTTSASSATRPPPVSDFDGLHAFDFGTNTSPVMEGFTQITPSTLYSKGRGYGLKDARVWRALDALQPEPLYQDFLCIESGGLAVDVPPGTYRVFVNIDSPSGFWGEYQAYRQRAIVAEGRPVVSETMDFEAFRKKYFRFWNVEDSPADNTFDKYQRTYYQEKQFDVVVADGQLNLEFRGESWACSVSTVVIFPLEKARQGKTFLDYLEAKRRFYFNNGFKRVLPSPTGDPLLPSDEDRRRGFVVSQPDLMKDVSYNDHAKGERGRQRPARRGVRGRVRADLNGDSPAARPGASDCPGRRPEGARRNHSA